MVGNGFSKLQPHRNPTSDLNSLVTRVDQSIPSNKSSVAREHYCAIPTEFLEPLLSMQGVVRSTMFVLPRFPSTNTPKVGIHHGGSVPPALLSTVSKSPRNSTLRVPTVDQRRKTAPSVSINLSVTAMFWRARLESRLSASLSIFRIYFPRSIIKTGTHLTYDGTRRCNQQMITSTI